MIELKNVSFSYRPGYKENGIQDINLLIKDGETVLICGESGCGKTTLLRLMSGLAPKYYEGKLEGVILINGESIKEKDISQLAGTISTVFQNPKSQFFSLTTKSELAFGCENIALPQEEIKRRIEKVCLQFKLENFMERSLFQLSGGEKQRIACASVSALEPQHVLLDEPSSNLDWDAIHDLHKCIRLWKMEKKTVVVVEHRLFYLVNLADRVIYMKDGHICEDIPIHEFKKRSRNEITKMGLRALNLDVKIDKETPVTENRFIRFENVSYTYPGTRNASISIEDERIPIGEIVGIVGRNGAGKSTFVRCFCGLESKMKGNITIDGVKITAKQCRRICYIVLQDVNHQLFGKSVEEEVAIGLKMSKNEKKTKANEVLKIFDLFEKKEEHPMSLSGGERQRTVIAGAVAEEREVLIFDEPTSGLDYRHMQEFSEVLKTLREKGKSIFVVSHDLEFLCRCCTAFVHIKEGKIAGKYYKKEETIHFLNRFFNARLI